MASSGNFATFNPLKRRASSYADSNIDNANQQLGSTTGNAAQLNVGFKLGDGKFYYEVYAASIPGSLHFGVCIDNADLNNVTSGKAIIGMRESGNKLVSTAPQTNSTSTSYGSSFASGGDILAVAIDFTNSTMEFFINNSSQGSFSWSSANDGSTYYPYVYMNTQVATLNTGQDSTFCGQKTAQGNTDENGFGDFYYTPPSGFLAMCSANLPISSDIDPAETDDDYPQKQFFISQYAGNLTNRTITTEAQPDLILIRSTNTTQNWYVVDSSRGITANKYLLTNTSDAEATFPQSNFTSVGATSVGISNGTWLNSTGQTLQMWMWKANGGTTSSNSNGSITSTVQANDKAGFSIITYTGTGSNATIGHGLSSAPEFMLFKRISSPAQNWKVYHKSLGSNKVLTLNTTSSADTDSTMFNNTDPTSSVISIGTQSNTNTSGASHICYAWSGVSGYSKFGEYIGNGNSDGAFIYTGFKVKFLIIRRHGGTDSFFIYDTTRSSSNPMGNFMELNTTAAQTGTGLVDFVGNGFKWRSTSASQNPSSASMVYAAFGDVPAKYNNAR